jgi:inosine-uridine nucleoside N-ribohydrolase
MPTFPRLCATAMLAALVLAPPVPAAPAAPAASAPARRLVIIDQDGSGPGGSNMWSMLALLQSPDVDVLGITIVTGNAWRDDEVRHTLRMLELVGRTDVPVAPGAVFPLVRTQEETRLLVPVHGQVGWLGAWGRKPESVKVVPAGANVPPQPSKLPGPFETPPLQEGEPHTAPLAEDAAHFMVRQVRAHPHEVTVFAAGPLTNVALAIAIEPRFAELAKGIVLMGGSLNPHTDDPEFAGNPRHEFNFWFDPEAARKVLRAPWPRIDVTTVDVSIRTMFTEALLAEIAKADSPAARYIARYSEDRYYMWDELAALAWLDPTLITKSREYFMDVDVGHGPTYGDTLTWGPELRPSTDVQKVHAQLDVDVARFNAAFVALMSAPSPRPPPPARRPARR